MHLLNICAPFACKQSLNGSVLPVCPGSLIERRCARGAVLAPESGRARHVVIWHHWGLHRLQCFVGSVTSGVR